MNFESFSAFLAMGGHGQQQGEQGPQKAKTRHGKAPDASVVDGPGAVCHRFGATSRQGVGVRKHNAPGAGSEGDESGVAGALGLEPRTCGFGIRCSTN